MKLKIMIVALLLVSVGIGSAVNRLPATEFVGDVDMGGNNIDNALYVNSTFFDGSIRQNLVLEKGMTRMVTSERQILTTGNNLIANITGPGTINFWWFTSESLFLLKDGLLNITYDGESEPAISIDLGTLMLHHFVEDEWYQAYGVNALALACSHLSIEQSSFVFSFPMPFEQSIKFEIYNPSTATTVYSQIAYVDHVAYPARLELSGNPFLNPILLDNYVDSYELLNLTGSGWLAWHSIAGLGFNDQSFLEGDVQIFVDGEANASIITSGFEDWFMSSFYFQGRTYGVPNGICSSAAPTSWPTAVTVGVDLLNAYGGIRYNDGIVVKLDNTESTDGALMSQAWLYYNASAYG